MMNIFIVCVLNDLPWPSTEKMMKWGSGCLRRYLSFTNYISRCNLIMVLNISIFASGLGGKLKSPDSPLLLLNNNHSFHQTEN